MNRALPLVILMIMGAMLLVAWSNISDAKTETVEKYNTLMENGKRFEEKKIYVDAVTQYETALNLRPDYELAMHVADLYTKLSNTGGYADALTKAIQCDRTNPEPYFLILDLYKKEGDSDQVYSWAKTIKDALTGSDRYTETQSKEIDELIKSYLGTLAFYDFPYDECYGFHYYQGSGQAYAKVRVGDKFGLVNAVDGAYLACEYSEVGLPNEGLIAYRDSTGDYYYVDGSGNRKIVPDSPAEYLGTFGGGYAPIKVNGKYGYIDTQMNESHFDYDFAGSFENGIAPVQQGGKWFAINTAFSQVGPVLDEILTDPYGFCAPYGVYFGKTGSTWGMYSVSGELLADGFEEVKQFASTQPAAVKKDGKWGFILLDGQMYMDPQYADADSYSIGYAPVKVGEKWGCINLENTMIVDPQFKILSAFSHEGYAYGENESGHCRISIKQYN